MAEIPEAGLVRAGWRFLRRHPRALAAVAAWSVVQATQTFFLGYGLARALDEGFLAGEAATGLGWLAVTAVAVLAGAMGTARVLRAVGGLAEPLRDSLVRGVVTRALRGAVARGRAEGTSAVSRLTHQVEIARDSFAGLVLVAQTFVVTTAGALVGLLLLAPVLLAVVVPPLLLGLAVFVLSLRPLARRQRAVLLADERLARSAGQTAEGVRDIVACGAEERAAGAVQSCIDAEFAAARSLGRWGLARVAALAVGGHVPVVLLLFLGPGLLDRGVTPGALVAALTFLTQAMLPALASLVQGVGAAVARLAVVIARLREEPQAAARRAPRPAPGGGHHGAAAARPAVELRGVTFAYGGRAEPVLRNVDLVLPEGGHLAVTGPSGVGKSTLAGLVAGLLTPGAGQVLLYGRPAAARGSAELAALRALIPQEAYVFSGTVAGNLGYLRPEPVPGAELLAAAAAVGAGELVERLGGPWGHVDPRALSAGERQLLALARAYLSPAPVVLLDEAACHLDPAAEAVAERAFAARPGGTLLVIAHRVSSALRAERVLVLDGADAVCGPHGEVLRRSALYRELACGWSDPTGAPGDADGVHPVARAGLADDGGDVVADGALGQPQALGYLRHGGAVRGE